jgi:hypothetical protein
MKRFSITALAAFAILLGTVPVARAADATCPPSNPTGTINGNLVVGSGPPCFLRNVTVNGNVRVAGEAARLYVEPGPGQTVKIGGNLQAAQCDTVNLASEGGVISVGGNIQIQGCMDESGYSGPTVTIGGNFDCENNSSGCFAEAGSVHGNVRVDNNSGNSGGSSPPGAVIEGNDVGGNVQVNGNSGISNTEVGGNTIGGNLQCARNTPGVTDNGVKNDVTGNKRGQCAGASF